MSVVPNGMEVESDRSREISGGAKGAAPTTLERFLQATASHRRQDVQLFVQAYSWAASAACSPLPPVKLNLEYEWKKDCISEKAQSRRRLMFLICVRQDSSGTAQSCTDLLQLCGSSSRGRMEEKKGPSRSGQACARTTEKLRKAWSTLQGSRRGRRVKKDVRRAPATRACVRRRVEVA